MSEIRRLLDQLNAAVKEHLPAPDAPRFTITVVADGDELPPKPDDDGLHVIIVQLRNPAPTVVAERAARLAAIRPSQPARPAIEPEAMPTDQPEPEPSPVAAEDAPSREPDEWAAVRRKPVEADGTLKQTTGRGKRRRRDAENSFRTPLVYR